MFSSWPSELLWSVISGGPQSFLDSWSTMAFCDLYIPAWLYSWSLLVDLAWIFWQYTLIFGKEGVCQEVSNCQTWHFHQKALSSFSRVNFLVQIWTATQNKMKMDFLQGRLHSPQPSSFRTSQKTNISLLLCWPRTRTQHYVPEPYTFSFVLGGGLRWVLFSHVEMRTFWKIKRSFMK